MPSKRPLNNITLNTIPAEYAYWRKRPNITRNNGNGVTTVKLPRKAYDARALNTWIKTGKNRFPENRQPISKKEIDEISLVVTVPRADRTKYRSLIKKRNHMKDSLTKLYSQKAKLDANMKTTRDNIGSLNKMINMLLREEFRSRSPVVSRRASPAVVSRRASPRRSHHASPVSNSNNALISLDELQQIIESQEFNA